MTTNINCSDYILVSNRMLEQIAQQTDNALAIWYKKWTGLEQYKEGNAVSVNVTRCNELGAEVLNSKYIQFNSQYNGSYFVHAPDEFKYLLTRGILCDDVITGDISDIERDVSNELFTTLISTIHISNKINAEDALTIQDTTINLSDRFKEWDGMVALEVSFSDYGNLIIVSNASNLIQFNIEEQLKSEIAHPVELVGNSKVKLTAILGEAELLVKNITDLVVGDIISMDKPLNEMVQLLLDDEYLCEGQLASIGEHYAIKITNAINS